MVKISPAFPSQIAAAVWAYATRVLTANRRAAYHHDTHTTTSTSYVDVVNVSGKGKLYYVNMQDLDNLTQNESLRITIDGVSITCVFDVPNTRTRVNPWASDDAAAPTGGAFIGIEFNSSLRVEHARATAGASGLHTRVAYGLDAA